MELIKLVKKNKPKPKPKPKKEQETGFKFYDCVRLLDFEGKETEYKRNAVLFIFNLIMDYRLGRRK